MRVRVNFTLSSNINTDILIPDATDQTDITKMTEAIENEILRILHEGYENLIDRSACLNLQFHDYEIVK